MSVTPASAADPKVPWRALLVLGAASFASSAALRFCDPLLPKLADSFMTTPGAAAIVVTTYSVAYGVFQLVTGPLGDRFGKVAVVAIGTILCGLFTMVSALATSLEQIALFRLAAGLTGAAIIPNCLAFIGDTIPMARRQAVLARYMVFMSGGAVSGQAIGGIVADLVGWQGVFVMVGAVLTLAGVILLVQMRSNPVLAARPARTAGGMVTAIIQMLSLGKSPAARLVLITVTLEAAIFFGAFTFLGAHLRNAYGISYTLIGALTALSAGGAVLYAWSGPMLLSRFSQANLITGSAILFVAAFLIFAAAPPLWLMATAIALGGAGFACFHNALQILVTQMNPEARGASFAVFAFAFFTGQTVGVAIAGTVFDRAGAAPLFIGAAVLLPLLVAWFGLGLRRIGPPPSAS
ncbi:MFS transporter [Phreatobacter sp.]|uniref:MFS transporter n=1 Tax=Phreatobacter sp. TaxID=1966341 RepID=UPI003F6F8C67